MYLFLATSSQRFKMKKSRKQKISNWLFYAFPLVIILTWWFFAFKGDLSEPVSAVLWNKQKQKKHSTILKYLSPLQRDVLHTALAGNYDLMIQLITDWDHDAQIIEQLGLPEIKRLQKNDFLRCQLLARQIKNRISSDEQLHYDLTHVTDDMGKLFDLSISYRRFLPQSYVAASFLLALTEPESIVALPQGLRDQKSIYPQKITDLIKLDVDRYNTEKLYEARPEIAFVADYSHPSTIQALGSQGIPLFTLKHVNSPEDIQHALIKIGRIANRPLEAELLYYFVEAAMHAIDNRFTLLNSEFNQTDKSPKVLFLKHHLTFSTPTSQTLTGKLLKRLGVKDLFGDESTKNKFAWTIPIHLEQILQIDPDYIIIGTNNLHASRKNILKEPVFRKLFNMKNKQISFVEDAVQESPSQYMVLAYYDLFAALNDCDLP